MSSLSTVLSDYIVGVAHVGFVVADLEAAVSQALALYGLDVGAVEYQPAPGEPADTRFAFFEVAGQGFEYIEPVSDAFRTLLFKDPSGGGGINHMAWNVRDLPAALELLAAKGIVPGYVTPDGMLTMGRRRMVYLDPATTGGLLVELLETLES
ncbi:MAG: VOC family protein [Pseudomonadota bacterium]